MKGEIVGLVQAEAKAVVRRAVVPAAFALVGGLFLLFMLAALFAALFFWLEPIEGQVKAALIVAGAAFIVALIALLPLIVKRSPPPPPPRVAGDGTLPQLVGLMSRSASNLGPRQLVVAATLLAAALVVSGVGQKKRG